MSRYDKIVDSLDSMAQYITDANGRGIDRSILIEKQADIRTLMLSFCDDVDAGKVQVNAVAVLRALKDLTCDGLDSKLSEPKLDDEKLVRELRLFSNTFKYVIRPETT